MKWFLFLFIFLNYFSLFAMNSSNKRAGDCYDNYNPLGILTLNFSKKARHLHLRKCPIASLNRARFSELQRNLLAIEQMAHHCDIALYFNKGHLSDQNSFWQLNAFLIWLRNQEESLIRRIIGISLVDNSLDRVPAESLRNFNERHQAAKRNLNEHHRTVSGSWLIRPIRPISLFLYGNNFTTNDQKQVILNQLPGISVIF